MTNDEIRELLRELAQKADAEGETRSKTVRITFDRKEAEVPAEETEPAPEKERRKKKKKKKSAPDAEETARKEEASSREEDVPAKEKETEGSPMLRWELPPEDEEEETGQDSFISVFPQGKGQIPAGTKEPEENGEPEDAGEESVPEDEERRPLRLFRKKDSYPVEDANFESDADAFRQAEKEDAPDAVSALFAGLAERFRERQKERRRIRDARKREAGKKAEASEAEGQQDLKDDHTALSGQEAAAETEGPAEAGAADGADRFAETEAGAGTESPDVSETAAVEEEVSETGTTAGEAESVEAEGTAGAEENKEAGTETEGSAGAEATAGPETAAGAEEIPKSRTPAEEAEELSGPEESSGAVREENGEIHSGSGTAAADENEENAAAEQESLQTRAGRRGLSGKEIIMITVGAALLVLIAAMGIMLLNGRSKGRPLETDEGLKASLVSEPKEWTSSAEIALDLRTASPIQSISVNGEPQEFTGTNRAALSLESRDRELEVMVVCEDTALKASGVVEMIDPDAPVLTVEEDNGLVTLQAEDELSGVAAIYCGKLTGLSDVPQYELYTKPFTAEEGAVYSCFAEDTAGNASMPVISDFSPVTEISLVRQNINLFPGDTAMIEIRTVPEHAFLEDLSMTNTDGSVIALEEGGRIRGLTAGSAQVRVSASGVTPVVCDVTVRDEAQITISAAGDVTLGDDVNFSTQNSFSTVYDANGSAYFFENVKGIFAADDITFVNLEGTLTDQGARENKQYAFRGDPSYTQILKDGSVEAVTLANNHSADYGEISFTDTGRYLDEAGIAWCSGDKIAYYDAQGVKVALIGIYVLADGLERSQQVTDTISEAKKNGAKIIVTAFHWGSERENEPDDTQKTLAHLAIDQGADLVVGHHPHVLQGIELYKGKYIAYSLANFCFGGNTNPSDKDTVIFQQNFHVTEDGKVEDGDIRVIPCTVSSQGQTNDYKPTPVSGDEKERILNRLRDLSEGVEIPSE